MNRERFAEFASAEEASEPTWSQEEEEAHQDTQCVDENKMLRRKVEALEWFIKNGVEYGYIQIPDKGDKAREIIDDILGGE